MPKSKCAFLLVTVSLLLLASCTITKRRYMDGYHVEWAGSKRPSASVETTADISESALVEERSADSSFTEVSPLDTLAATTITPSVVTAEKFTQKVKSRTVSSLKRRIEEKPVASAFAQTALRQFDSNDEGGITGIKWLDIVIGILLMALIIVFVIYSSPNLKAEVNAAWAAITANIWISLIYFVLILLIIFLLFAALDALFGFMLPSGSAGSRLP